jgi:hypothetical protein
MIPMFDINGLGSTYDSHDAYIQRSNRYGTILLVLDVDKMLAS